MPKVLRAIGFGALLVGLLFKLQHWPGAEHIIVAAWFITLSAMIVHIIVEKAIIAKDASRDLFMLGVVSNVVDHVLHLPGKGIAIVITVLGAIGLFWYDRDRFLPGKGDQGSYPWLFYAAVVLVTVGTLFRIQHWPNSTLLLIGGLAVAGIWFVVSMKEDK